MKIGSIDQCTLCGNPFKHRRVCNMGWLDDERTIKEVTLILSHAGCRALLEKKKFLQQQLLDVEYEIFMKVNV